MEQVEEQKASEKKATEQKATEQKASEQKGSEQKISEQEQKIGKLQRSLFFTRIFCGVLSVLMLGVLIALVTLIVMLKPVVQTVEDLQPTLAEVDALDLEGVATDVHNIGEMVGIVSVIDWTSVGDNLARIDADAINQTIRDLDVDAINQTIKSLDVEGINHTISSLDVDALNNTLNGINVKELEEAIENLNDATAGLKKITRFFK